MTRAEQAGLSGVSDEAPTRARGNGAAASAPEPPGGERANPIVGFARSLPSLDLLLLGGLLFLTEAFGRSFSKVGWGSQSVYVTEVTLVAVVVIAFVRLGPRGVVARVPRAVPVLPLLVFWLAGAIALARGVADWGLSLTLHDVGLAEYSIVLVLVAVLADNKARARWLSLVLVAGGVVALLMFAAASVLPTTWPPWTWGTVGSASSGIYIGMYVCWIGSRLAHGLPVRRLHYPVLVLGITLMALSYARSVWIAAFVALGVVVALAPRGRVLRTALGGAAVVVIAVGAAYGFERIKVSDQIDTLRTQAAAAEAQSIGPAVSANPASRSGAKSAPGSSAKSTPGSGATSAAPGSGGKAANPASTPVAQPTGETFASNLSEDANWTWRLAIWKFMLKRTVYEPVLGVGFGTPTNFYWDGQWYDDRRGDINPYVPTQVAPFDVTGPHNSFVDIVFRMGLLGALSLLALVVVAIVRVWPSLRMRTGGEDRAWVVAVVAMLVLNILVASANVSLEGPFMGIFFWAILGLLLVLPTVLRRPSSTSVG